MTRIAPAGRIGAALLFSAALVGGVGVADAKPCLMQLPNGQWAPCAPPVISTMPGEYGDAGSGAVESESPELSMVSVAPSGGGGGGDASGGGDADDGPIGEHEVSISQPDDDPKDSGSPGSVDTPPKDEKDPDRLKEEQAQKEREEREKAEKEKAEQAEKEKAEKEKADREKQEQADKEKEQNQP
ncbi:hypothetical protein [Gordonia paraffinivorans]|uniref:Uncharacterized protein n=1 Tax=Gordonia paraffinivorans TaxID=175628 RepID=A0ABD7UZB4_9ACTN|nr:hypothetical protein [Gordonia paraffinivorans]MCD2144314.1 hypothetical protein [Gordonia paraffinivorans]VFA82251.1 Uncharacterised protein [Gordonia paraffinivorans]